MGTRGATKNTFFLFLVLFLVIYVYLDTVWIDFLRAHARRESALFFFNFIFSFYLSVHIFLCSVQGGEYRALNIAMTKKINKIRGNPKRSDYCIANVWNFDLLYEYMRSCHHKRERKYKLSRWKAHMPYSKRNERRGHRSTRNHFTRHRWRKPWLATSRRRKP